MSYGFVTRIPVARAEHFVLRRGTEGIVRHRQLPNVPPTTAALGQAADSMASSPQTGDGLPQEESLRVVDAILAQHLEGGCVLHPSSLAMRRALPARALPRSGTDYPPPTDKLVPAATDSSHAR